MKKTIARGIINAVMVMALTWPCSTLAFGDPSNTIESKESFYNNIYVLKEGKYVAMTFGYNKSIFIESLYNPNDEMELPAEYTRYMTLAPVYAATSKTILEIGFGGGRTTWYLHKSLPNSAITTVELDPDVISLAKKYFGVREEKGFSIVNDDGRRFLMKSSQRFDVILLDAYRGPFVPFHLLTKEFYELVKSHLAEGGVVAQNVEPSTMLFDSSFATIHSVFPNVEGYPAGGNMVLVAYDGPPRLDSLLMERAGDLQKQYSFRYPPADLLRARRDFDTLVKGVDRSADTLTDDFAPVEALKAIEVHNRKW